MEGGSAGCPFLLPPGTLGSGERANARAAADGYLRILVGLVGRARQRGMRGRKVTNSDSGANYRLGAVYSLTTAFLMATQEPFSFPAASRLTSVQFVCLTQVALLVSIPLLTLRPKSRRDFFALLGDRSNYGKLALIFAIGMCGLLLYNRGLSHSRPIIIAAILNLSPFWAALVALVISKVAIPVSRTIFFSCLVAAFAGAMAVAWSQIGVADKPTMSQVWDNLLHGSWVYAIPVPICSALGGTLIGKWFRNYDESGAIAANFLFSTSILIPVTLVILYFQSELQFNQLQAVILMMVGTIIAASLGRVFYQVALSTTGNDNGFVTMFFLLVPALTVLISLPLSWWIADLRFTADPVFFFGLLAIAASLLLFSLKSWKRAAPDRK
jgi:drug/metabolite transporter (DMT)-like permease